MQIVIDIPDNMQEMCRWHQDCVCNLTSLEVDILAEAVRNGIVLPKNHGRLVDADAILEDPYGNTYKDIDIAETIIEADEDEEVNE